MLEVLTPADDSPRTSATRAPSPAMAFSNIPLPCILYMDNPPSPLPYTPTMGSPGGPYPSSRHRSRGFQDAEFADKYDPTVWPIAPPPTTLELPTAESDDWLHDPAAKGGPRGKDDDDVDTRGAAAGTIFSTRGILNIGFMALLVAAILALFAGYPIMSSTRTNSSGGAFNIGGTNGTGQVPLTMGQFGMVDKDTPRDAYTRNGFTGVNAGVTYDLVWSDEFEVDGRTFFPGDDPYWEAVDLHYWATNNLEWYDPGFITTANGSLVITLTAAADPAKNHNLNYTGGMMTTWNKFCFSESAYIETKVRLPGSPKVPGLWPAVWTMGNLGRAGYGGSLEGLWPYTYSDCDVGTVANQSINGIPVAATNTGKASKYDGALSFLPGQRLSACSCPGSDHPGPKLGNGNFAGRSAPEIDIFEAQVDDELLTGHMSMSSQWAPFNAHWQYHNGTGTYVIYDDEKTALNKYKGSITQQAASGVVQTNQEAYEHPASGAAAGTFDTYGFEYHTGNDGYITWQASGAPTWTLYQSAMQPDAKTEIGTRWVAKEPMYLIANLGLSKNFGVISPDLVNLWPVHLEIDYIRVYQPTGTRNIGCDPVDYPTGDYILDHPDLYSDPNITTLAQADKYKWPSNSFLLASQGLTC